MAEQLKWSRHDIDPSGLASQHLEAGPQAKASFWSRARGTSAAVLAAERSSMFGGEDADEQIRALLQRRAHDAVAVIDEAGTVQVGVAEDDAKHLFGGDYQPDQNAKERWATLAVRLGSSPVSVTLGLWLPDEESWYGTDRLIVVEDAMPHGAVQGTYRHTQVVELPR